MTWSTAGIPGLHGRRALVTGVTGDLGRETAREPARAGAHVILTARHRQRLEETAHAIAEEPPGARLDALVPDLADLSSVRRAAHAALRSTERLDILVDNAGVMAAPRRRTVDGFELQVGTNHLGHFALTGLLGPALSRARVVTVSSLVHRVARRAPLYDPRGTRPYNRWLAYAESELANLRFALERPPGQGGGSFVGPSRLLQTRGPPRLVGMSAVAKDPIAAARLWQLSEAATNVTFIP